MNVSLTPDLKRLVHDKVRAGSYPTPSKVIQEGLRLLRERDANLAALRDDVQAGFDAIENGEYEEHDARSTKRLAEEIKSRGRARLAAKRTKTG